MDAAEQHGLMWCDLFVSELDARGAAHRVTSRAEIYLTAGLPFERVLDALKVDETGWNKRVAALRAWEETNRSAGAGLTLSLVPQSAPPPPSEIPATIQSAEAPVLSVAEAAQVLRMDPTTARRQIKAGTFPVRVIQIGSRNKVLRSDLERFLAGNSHDA